MKKIGILGGLGPESTADYYKKIILAFNTLYQEFAYPEIIIYSANLNDFMGFVDSQHWSILVKWLLEKISHLNHAGADFIAIASNTPHIVIEELQLQSPIPILSIVSSTCAKAKQMGVQNVGLLGTKLTMESAFYKKPFIEQGISVVTPAPAERDYIHQKLLSEIEKAFSRIRHGMNY